MPVGQRVVAAGQRHQVVGMMRPALGPLLQVVQVGVADGVARAGEPAAAVPRPHRHPGVANLDGPVLLVDDFADSRWTLTVAARKLRHAGAPAVLPFALALAG